MESCLETRERSLGGRIQTGHPVAGLSWVTQCPLPGTVGGTLSHPGLHGTHAVVSGRTSREEVPCRLVSGHLFPAVENSATPPDGLVLGLFCDEIRLDQKAPNFSHLPKALFQTPVQILAPIDLFAVGGNLEPSRGHREAP